MVKLQAPGSSQALTSAWPDRLASEAAIGRAVRGGGEDEEGAAHVRGPEGAPPPGQGRVAASSRTIALASGATTTTRGPGLDEGDDAPGRDLAGAHDEDAPPLELEADREVPEGRSSAHRPAPSLRDPETGLAWKRTAKAPSPLREKWRSRWCSKAKRARASVCWAP
jgi:hypothetical protein